MKVLFFMRSTVYVRNFESTLRELARRGHHVHVAADAHHLLDPTDLIGRLSREHPGITYGPPPRPAAKKWSKLGVELRKTVDYLRYLEPEYRNAPKLRERAEQLTPVMLAPRWSSRLSQRGSGRALLRRALSLANRAIPPDSAIDAFIRDQRPDLVVVTPLVEPGSPQSDYVRSARALGIPTALCVYSWDNLTSKGLIHDPVDAVTVWNEPMKREAVTLHHVAAAKVIVTGAGAYDHWFTWQPRDTRQQFCARVGLDPARPYLLYLCSSRFIAPNEVPYVRRWIQGIRAASRELREVGILIRPHPQNMERWRALDMSDLENVAIWPRRDGNPTDAEKRSEYYDSIAHSVAVVGINTSALIESAIVGRGVYTMLAPEFRSTQEGTLHFHHLREVNGGLLHVAGDMPEHVAHLEAAVRDPEAGAAAGRRFVEAFVRPYGVAEAAAPRVVAALERTAAAGSRADSGPWWARLARPALGKLAIAVATALRPIEREEEERRRTKRRDQALRVARRNALAAAAAASDPAASPAIDQFRSVRDRVRRLYDAEANYDGLTPAEQRTRAALEPLWAAAPEALTELARHRGAISGIRAEDYEGREPRAPRMRFERDLRRLLVRGDSTLWLDEPTMPGSFGFKTLGKRYNEDTLRFFRVISLLQDAALIRELRGTARRTVWEIGGGWGGFAYHVKTLCPNVTYLITGRPEQFLVSALYLRTLFPDAAFRFFDASDPDGFWRDWERVDFAFAPESVVPCMRPPSIDLTADVMALERMNDARVEMHVRRAYELGSRHFVSTFRLPQRDDEAGPAVGEVIERLYWPHPVSAPGSLPRRLSLERGDDRTYFLGWKRLRV